MIFSFVFGFVIAHLGVLKSLSHQLTKYIVINKSLEGLSINDITHLGGGGIGQKVTLLHKPI